MFLNRFYCINIILLLLIIKKYYRLLTETYFSSGGFHGMGDGSIIFIEHDTTSANSLKSARTKMCLN